MANYNMDYNYDDIVADRSGSERVGFIRRTYLHVAGALLALTCVCAALLHFVPSSVLMGIFGQGKMGFLLVFLGFMAVSWVAERWAQSDMSTPMQYLGLGLYVVAEGVILWPMLWLALAVPAFQGILPQAVVMTLALSAGLTCFVFVTGKDFSFLRGALVLGSFIILGLILAGIFFGFSLGIWFTAAVLAFTAAVMLYQTSQVMYHYRSNQHVAASLAIFSSVATMFYYILRILMQTRSSN